MMKILVVGNGGQVGTELARYNTNFEVIALTYDQLDITKDKDVIRTIDELKPNLLINAAAYTAVDKAEEEPDIVFKVNRDAPELLAQCCANHNIPLVHLSTDYVFDGKSNHSYCEDDKTNPLSIYGKSKLDGELLVKKNLEKYIILRLSAVFDVCGDNFVKTILRLAQEREELSVVADQLTCPTWAFHIAETIFKVVNQILNEDNLWGVYHYCDVSPVSWYDFAAAIIDEAKRHKSLCVKKLLAIPAKEYISLAKRPERSILNCDKIHKVFGIEQQSWQIGLKQIMRELL